MTNDVEQKIEMLKWAIENQPILPMLQEHKIEDVEILIDHIPAGKTIPVVSMRNAIFMRQTPFDTVFDFDYPRQQLRYKGGVWMTNLPQEIYQMLDPMKVCEPRTLVGGLGLGIFSHLHALHHGKPNVTVEFDKRIIDLVSPFIDSGEIVNASLFDYVKEMKKGEFDSAFFDIWQPTGERVWISHVVPLRRSCRGKIDNKKIHCWNEEEMQGQLAMSLERHAFVDPDWAAEGSWLPTTIMAEKGRKLGLPILHGSGQKTSPNDFFQKMEEAVTPELTALVNLFIYGPGTDEWEAEFGEQWDRVAAAIEAKHPKDEDDDE